MTLKTATQRPIRRFAAIAHRTRPRRAKRTGARYSPPPTPVKPERTPIGSAKRLPTASPSRRSARVPEGASKESSRRTRAPSTFPGLRLTHLIRLAGALAQTSKAVAPRRLSFGGQHLHAVRSRRTDRMRPRFTEIEPRYRRALFFVRNWT